MQCGRRGRCMGPASVMKTSKSSPYVLLRHLVASQGDPTNYLPVCHGSIANICVFWEWDMTELAAPCSLASRKQAGLPSGRMPTGMPSSTSSIALRQHGRIKNGVSGGCSQCAPVTRLDDREELSLAQNATHSATC